MREIHTRETDRVGRLTHWNEHACVQRKLSEPGARTQAGMSNVPLIGCLLVRPERQGVM